MAEQNRGEGEPKTESLEEQRYKAMLAAQAEEDRLMGEMDKILETAEDRTEAERKILRELVPQINEARRVAWQAYKEWEGAMREAIAAHEREMAVLEKEMGE